MLAGADGRAHQKAVKLGIRNGEDVQIIEGLSEGEKVISNGAYGLPDTTKIKIEAAKAPAEEAKPQAGGSKAPSEGSVEK
jgi:multidrug efflux pump subunit AcrA (membrane-fusion protein)